MRDGPEMRVDEIAEDGGDGMVSCVVEGGEAGADEQEEVLRRRSCFTLG